MKYNHQLNYGEFDPPFPDNYVQYGSPKRNRGSNYSIAESKTEKIKKWFSKSREEHGYEQGYESGNESESDIYQVYDQQLNNNTEVQNLNSNNNQNNGYRETEFPFDKSSQNGTGPPQAFKKFQEHIDLNSSSSANTFLTSNRPQYEPFDSNGLEPPKVNLVPRQDDSREKKSPIIVVSSRHNIINNIHSALKDPYMGLKIGPPKISDVCLKLESYIAKKKQSIHLLQKTINDFKSWAPQGDVFDPEDISSMKNHFVELMEYELEFEVKTIETLESTLSILKTVSFKENTYMESQKQLKTSIKKFNEFKVKKNNKAANNEELLKSKCKDSQRRYSTEQKILQEAISIDLRKQYISHNYQNFANNSDMITRSKENICKELSTLLKVDKPMSYEMFEDIKKQRLSYIWNQLTTQQQEDSRKQNIFQNGVIDRNDSLLGCIYKEFSENKLAPLQLPEAKPSTFQFMTALGNETNQTFNLIPESTSRSNNTSSGVIYTNENEQWNKYIQSLKMVSNSGDYEDREGSNKENETVIQNSLNYIKQPESTLNESLNRSMIQPLEIPTCERYECNTVNLTENKWQDE